MGGVGRGGKGERRARRARKDRTWEDRAHFDGSTACHAGYHIQKQLDYSLSISMRGSLTQAVPLSTVTR